MLLHPLREMGYPREEGYLQAHLQDYRILPRKRYHESHLIAFEIDFTANALLPNRIAIGKGVSHGFGVVKSV